MTQNQNWDEITKSYPDEWVAVTDYEIEGRDLTRGVVLFHSKNRMSLHEQTKALEQPCAVIFTGQHKRGLIGLYVQDLED